MTPQVYAVLRDPVVLQVTEARKVKLVLVETPGCAVQKDQKVHVVPLVLEVLRVCRALKDHEVPRARALMWRKIRTSTILKTGWN